MDATQLEQIRSGQGFFAALDQSGGSTPKALAEYGIGEDRYTGDEQMFDLVHAMRTRVITDPAFDGSRIIGAILFEQTMDRSMDGVPTAQYLWERKQVVPFLKIDKGLADVADNAQLMKPIDGLDELLTRAVDHGIFGTKMRSVIKDADPKGVAAIVEQQFDLGSRIAAHGLVPILEPEVSIDAPNKAGAERQLRDALATRLDTLGPDTAIVFKLTLPTEADLYSELADDPRVLRLLALSGGYARDEACARLAQDHTMIASFSRALLEGLTDGQTDEQFHDRLEATVQQVYDASTVKEPAA